MTGPGATAAWPRRRLRLSLPFTVVREPGVVRLIAGEDHRYTLRAEAIEAWLPPLLEALDGARGVAEALAVLPEGRRAAADRLLQRLLGERVLVDDPPRLPAPRRFAPRVEGQGELFERVGAAPAGGGEPLAVLCQDRLDLAAALDFHAGCLRRGEPALWATTGPLARGWVGPLFLPGDGPCLRCLLTRFRALSPAPELYGALEEHARRGGEVRPVPFPTRGVGVLAELLLWKVELAAAEVAPPALFRLHVLDAGALTTTAHRVARDHDCAACAALR